MEILKRTEYYDLIQNANHLYVEDQRTHERRYLERTDLTKIDIMGHLEMDEYFFTLFYPAYQTL